MKVTGWERKNLNEKLITRMARCGMIEDSAAVGILHAINRACGPDMWCSRSYSTLAEETCFKKRKVGGMVRDLTKRGWLLRHRIEAEGHNRYLYAINLPKENEIEAIYAEFEARKKNENELVAPNATNGVSGTTCRTDGHHVPLGVAPHATFINPIFNKRAETPDPGLNAALERLEANITAKKASDG